MLEATEVSSGTSELVSRDKLEVLFPGILPCWDAASSEGNLKVELVLYNCMRAQPFIMWLNSAIPGKGVGYHFQNLCNG